MKFICFISLFQSFALIAQIEIAKLSKYELHGAVSNLEEKIYCPSGEQLKLDETNSFVFDERGRLLTDTSISASYGNSSAKYMFNDDLLIQSEFTEEGIINRQFYYFEDRKHVATYYYREFRGDFTLDFKDTLVYFEDHFNIKSINVSGVEFNIRDIYKDSIGRDTLHIGYLTNGDKEYERRFRYIEGTDLFVDETTMNGEVVAKTDYEYQKDGTHELTTFNPHYEIFISRELRYNTEGFVAMSSVDEPMRGASSYIEYTYNYDDVGNWIQRRAIDKKGELFEVVERTITYFK